MIYYTIDNMARCYIMPIIFIDDFTDSSDKFFYLVTFVTVYGYLITILHYIKVNWFNALYIDSRQFHIMNSFA